MRIRALIPFTTLGDEDFSRCLSETFRGPIEGVNSQSPLEHFSISDEGVSEIVASPAKPEKVGTVDSVFIVNPTPSLDVAQEFEKATEYVVLIETTDVKWPERVGEWKLLACRRVLRFVPISGRAVDVRVYRKDDRPRRGERWANGIIDAVVAAHGHHLCYMMSGDQGAVPRGTHVLGVPTSTVAFDTSASWWITPAMTSFVVALPQQAEAHLYQLTFQDDPFASLPQRPQVAWYGAHRLSRTTEHLRSSGDINFLRDTTGARRRPVVHCRDKSNCSRTR